MHTFLTLIFLSIFCCQTMAQNSNPIFCNSDVTIGAERFDQYLEKLEGKKVALLGNQSSLINQTHLVDVLLNKNVDLVKLFSPEHGFRGKADAGEKVNSGVDDTGLPIISLYGSHKKPSADDLNGVDIMLFDIQDVGARFYTYISTLHYVMEACAENGVNLIVLDRPNPNGFYVDGPVLNKAYTSFVGMHPVPIVHGMSIGEYAQMICGEDWLGENVMLDLMVVSCLGWDHTKFYKLPTKPSPNLPNMLSVYLYPSLCLFEGTVVSVGRGTDWPFQIIGHPDFKNSKFSFVPSPNFGAKKPKLNGQECMGIDFIESGLNVMQNQNQIQLSWFLQFYEDLKLSNKFFLSNHFINLLAGSNDFKKSIISGMSEAEIRQSWEPQLSNFKVTRKKYLLYPDFK